MEILRSDDLLGDVWGEYASIIELEDGEVVEGIGLGRCFQVYNLIF